MLALGRRAAPFAVTFTAARALGAIRVRGIIRRRGGSRSRRRRGGSVGARSVTLASTPLATPVTSLTLRRNLAFRLALPMPPARRRHSRWRRRGSHHSHSKSHRLSLSLSHIQNKYPPLSASFLRPSSSYPAAVRPIPAYTRHQLRVVNKLRIVTIGTAVS